MSKIDWRRAKPTGQQSSGGDISDKAAADDRLIAEQLIKKREKKERKILNKLPANWLTTPEQVAAYKQALKDKKNA